MTEQLQYIVTITLLFILSVFWISSKRQREQETKPENTLKEATKIIHNKKLQRDEILDTLDWMLSKSIITPQEYTKLVGKCLPFLE